MSAYDEVIPETKYYFDKVGPVVFFELIQKIENH